VIVGVPKETYPGERRVALIPGALGPLVKAGAEVVVESGAGQGAGFPDGEYASKGARIAATRQEVFEVAEVVLQVRCLGANPEAGRADLEWMRPGQAVIGFWEPLAEAALVAAAAARGVMAFAMELMPRITRAQMMDALSSMATVAGYKAVLLAADRLPKMFPMLMTAAGTLAPAKVFVIGAGVAGLQAIATARRLGAVVEAYDVRPAVKEQVQSLGARFLELPLETAGAEDKSGYARALDEEFYRKQRELMLKAVAEHDVVISTAAVPGRKAPLLITREMVAAMRPGSVIVDVAAERGGNCELTRPGETVVENGVVILGPLNLPSAIPVHASQMYARNITSFLLSMVKEGRLAPNFDDEIVRETLLARDGRVVHPQVLQRLGSTQEP
jgi:NAD(P) transhydrogenase subunit alpha